MQLLVLFGPVLAELALQLLQRLKTQVSTTISGTAMFVAVTELTAMMGCDAGLAEAAAIGAVASAPLLFGVDSGQIMPTLMEAVKARIKKEKETRGLPPSDPGPVWPPKSGPVPVFLLVAGLASAGCSLEQVQKTQDVLVRLRADAQTVAIVGCAHVPYAQSTIPAILALLPPGTDKDKLINGVTLASDLAAEFCAKVQAAATTTTIQ